ncbi:MAG TPA: succinylglutamate desuccinylase/aspartoacylase family protein [Saprospiraceae bacterium]|nr:succinylglutamate desuccinylase/aspartoacylase family protein [Saprospiraceae bacterium]HMQ84417.1 succinylglutamate desuccinylase/aspartoacylase family protein [Saprospiraceae bacterium]
MESKRLIGRFRGTEPGPLLICFGGVHGNEAAGILALETLFHLLDREPLVNPGFLFHGELLALKGNLQALQVQQRFIARDLNRMWTKSQVEAVKKTPEAELHNEALELKQLIATIEEDIEQCQPEKLVLLDLHTTAAFGGIFAIPSDEPESLEIAKSLHAPVVRGMMRGLQGTSLHYFNTENFGMPTTAVCFEAGQHQEELSVQRALAAIINCMRSIGCVRPEDVENRHDELLIRFSAHLPKVCDLVYRHPIAPDDAFKMQPGYQNFQAIQRGELLAHDRHGPIYAPEDGYILMPLYQAQGEDGFFLLKAAGH